MADFRLRGSVTQLGASRFSIVVSAIRIDDAGVSECVHRLATSADAAEEVCRALIIEVGAALRAGGGRIVDVEVD